MSQSNDNSETSTGAASTTGTTPKSSLDSSVQTQPNPNGPGQVLNRIIKRFGGRHLIFRTEMGSWRWLPRPYALVSTFRGPIWLFYGAGQVWLTHRKYQEFDGWLSRVPRLPAPKTIQLLDKLTDDLTEFTHYCNEHGLEGTVVVEPKVIEFHWTFGYELEKEKMKTEKTNLLDAPFQKLVDAYLHAKKELGFSV